jgi:DNA-binding GntR family transcriptional regulator
MYSDQFSALPDLPTFNNLKVPPSLKEMAFESIKAAILSQKLVPGKVYNEQGLAKELGISKTPVREALLDLSIKGFITLLPRKGVQLNILTEKDIRDLFEVRMALETAIVRSITPKLTADELKRIQEIHLKERGAIQNNDRISYLRIDREFHLCLASLTENRYMISSIENIRDLIDWVAFRAIVRLERMGEVEEEHSKVIQKLEERDTRGAEFFMEEHIRITERIVLGLASQDK